VVSRVIHVTRVGNHNAELTAKIEAYLDATNNNQKPFVWTAATESILAKIARGRRSRLRTPAFAVHARIKVLRQEAVDRLRSGVACSASP
jgi:hypothetical protein